MKKSAMIIASVAAVLVVLGGSAAIWHYRKFKVGDKFRFTVVAGKGDLPNVCITEGSHLTVEGTIAGAPTNGTAAVWYDSLKVSGPFSGSCTAAVTFKRPAAGDLSAWSILYMGQPGVAPSYGANSVFLSNLMPAFPAVNKMCHVPF
jgi:hypothetical protein